MPNAMSVNALSAIGSTLNVARPGTFGSATLGSIDRVRSSALGGAIQ